MALLEFGRSSYRYFDVGNGSLGEAKYSLEGGRNWDLSPDGEEIAILNNDIFTRMGQSEVTFVKLVSGEAQTLRADGLIQSITYDKDGEGLVITGMRVGGEPYALAHLSRKSEITVLWSNKTNWIFQPVLSADGNRVAFAVRDWDIDLGVLKSEESDH